MRPALLLALAVSAYAVDLDRSAVRPGPVTVTATADAATVSWTGADARAWRMEFALQPKQPLIRGLWSGDARILAAATPQYNVETGKRRGGWNEFFDFPPSHPEGTRRFMGVFNITAARARSVDDRIEIEFDGLEMGLFRGKIRYTFYPGSNLIRQDAVVSTNEPDTAFYYDASLRMAQAADRRPGEYMESDIGYYDTEGQWQVVNPQMSERHTVAARYRVQSARVGDGSIAVFPPPHQYFMPRDFTTNLGYLWHTTWRGNITLGIRQWPDDNWIFYPWMNAPPGTEQRMGMFLYADAGDFKATADSAIRYTHADRFPALPGYKTLAPHWHFRFWEEAQGKPDDWTPALKSTLTEMGINIIIPMDFHGDGHPRDLTDLRFEELDAYYQACRRQSDGKFLMIPAEEANVHYKGHFGLVFPKPIYWQMGRPEGKPFKEKHPKYGTVYRVADEKELLALVRAEGGLAYQAHPRTKGSKLYPDGHKDAEYFRDGSWFGAGWKAMPVDLSSPRLGDRVFDLLDDMWNWGLEKKILSEADVFQIDESHELYAHMNANYVKLRSMPSFDNYRAALVPLERGEFFMSTGEVLLPEWSITGSGDNISVRATIKHTFPLEFVEVVWGDGTKRHIQQFRLPQTREFADQTFSQTFAAPGWKWARLAVWDVAANGAWVNPVPREQKVVAVDAWHNKEADPHYRWEGVYNGGFSQLGRLLQAERARLATIAEPLSAGNLKGVDVLIIVDPDTPKESDSPHYIEPGEIAAVKAWVEAGGRLVLLGNDPGNAEFEHFNQLAWEFGIEFLEKKHVNAEGLSKFTAGNFYAVDVAPLKLDPARAKALLSDNGAAIIGRASVGKGTVIAVGDPWIYDEYINHAGNRQLATRIFRDLLK